MTDQPSGLGYTWASMARAQALSLAADAAAIGEALARPASDGPGSLAALAHTLTHRSTAALRQAVIAERLSGTSWSTIGAALGGISKQAASERYQ
ncbi:hypothetical protein, partial [Streptosporangium jomthongense]